MRIKLLVASAIMASGYSAAQAVYHTPTSYSFNTGAGYPDSTGQELTDGFIADQHYASYPGGDPYVGWQSVDPTITFSFGGSNAFGSLIVWVDDNQGGAGVTAPASISAVINGTNYANFTVGAPLDAGFTYPLGYPFSYPGGGTPYYLDLGGVTGSTIDLTLNRGGEWTFVSEVQFSSDPPPTGAVPEPATWAMMIGGFGLIGAATRRRRVPATA